MLIQTNDIDQRQENDFIELFFQEAKQLKTDATNNGQVSLAEFADNVLDFIEYAKADSERLNWLEENLQHLKIQTKDLRNWIDIQKGK